MTKKGYKLTKEHKRKIADANKKFTDEQEQQICNKYLSEEKPSLATLAKEWNCSVGTIEYILKRNGYKVRTHREVINIFTKKEEKQICKGYFSKEKLSTIELAKKWGCVPSTIGDIIRRNGYKLRTLSEALKGEKNFNYGKNHSGKNAPFYGHHFSEEWKQKRRKFTKKEEQQICSEYFSKENPSIVILAKKWNCGNTTIRKILERNGYVLRTLSDTALIRIQNNPGPYKDTEPELKMKEILTSLNIPFEHQFRVEGISHSFDFHVLNTNILIEVDGNYWHCNPKVFKKLSKIQKQWKRQDIKINKLAKEKDFILIRFWEKDILNNEKNVRKELRKYLC